MTDTELVARAISPLNVARRWWRQSSREVLVADIVEPPGHIGPALELETAVGVRDALALLRQRSALVLFYFADLPVSEIARRNSAGERVRDAAALARTERPSYPL